MRAVQTDDGIEIRDGDDVITTVATWPPRKAEALDELFEATDISTPQKELFKILFAVVELQDEREQS